jgi:two-component system sensor histidine kinase VanS
MANFITAVMRSIFGMTTDSALTYYQNVFRRNMDFLIYMAVAVFFVILSRFLLSQFERYFNEISDGLDVLAENKNGDIKLSSEMATMEHKLKAIKRTLEERQQEARSAEQRKNDVVMYLAHDIKTPLTSVI